MGLISDLFDGIKDFLHPSIDEGFQILQRECEPELHHFCDIRDYDLTHLSFSEKESIFLHRLSIKIDSIRRIYREVEGAKRSYPEGFDALFYSLFSKRMATDKDSTFGKIDADYQVSRNCWEKLEIPIYSGVSLVYYTYTKEFVAKYYSLLYSDGEFSKYIFEGNPAFDNFRRHLSSIFRIKEVPIDVKDLSLEHVRLLHEHLAELPGLHEVALLDKKFNNEIENNPLRKKYLTQFLGVNGVDYDNKQYAISHILELDSFIRDLLRQECDRIKKYYPAGYAYYCRHNSSYDLSKIVEAKNSIRAYNLYGNLCEPYDRWEKEQVEFTNWCKGILSRYSFLSAFNEEFSSPKYKRLLINGSIGNLDYKVSMCSFFPICSDVSLDYSILAGYQNYYRAYHQAIQHPFAHICDSRYYEALDSFIGQLGDKYSKTILIVVLPTEGKNTDTVNNKEFSIIRQKCVEKGVSFLDLSAEDESSSTVTENDITKYRYILLLDSLFCEKSVERMLSLFSELDDYHPAIFSISSLYELPSEVMRERIERRKREIEQERIRKEEERRRQERERIEREKRAVEELKRQEEERKKRAEERRLYDVSHLKKASASQISEYLEKNGIRWFYHFTDKRNLASIKKNGGLYSWYYCKEKGITIDNPGGSSDSRELDARFGLQDYVRLSFCNNHPMTYRLELDGYDLAYLRIKVDVASLESTMFSDENAASNNHHHGASFDDLKRVDIEATRMRRVSRSDPAFHKHQAEVMVKTFIPLEYIINLNDYEDWL